MGLEGAGDIGISGTNICSGLWPPVGFVCPCLDVLYISLNSTPFAFAILFQLGRISIGLRGI